MFLYKNTINFQTNNHQGVVAHLSEIFYSSLEQLIENHDKNALFVLLDGITDTRNMGAIIRSASAAKATAVVIPTWFCSNNGKQLSLQQVNVLSRFLYVASII